MFYDYSVVFFFPFILILYSLHSHLNDVERVT